MGLTYKDAGVDIDAGAALVDAIKPLARATGRPEVLDGLGGFAGLFRVPAGYREPILVSGTDGVGTKLRTALTTGRHGTVGIDLVAMAVNDVIVTGAEPLFFLDYYATAKLEVEVARAVIAGIATGCSQAGCALLGGETAEMPGMYKAGDYDLAGFCVGVVERCELRDGSDLAADDVVIGLTSSGLHSNGHSLARKALLETLGLSMDATPTMLGGASVADALLEPTRIYVRALRSLADAGLRFKTAAHITGGGLTDNCPRMLRSEELAIELDASTWEVPPIFDLISSAGIEQAEMRRTFNLGIGMVVVCDPTDAEAALAALAEAGEAPRIIGHLRPRADGVPLRYV